MKTYEIVAKHDGGDSYLYIKANNKKEAIERFAKLENAPKNAIKSIRLIEDKIKPENFKRISSDVNGNPRYVVHYVMCARIGEGYDETVKRMNAIGGRKFHNKQYGGGIAFQSYNLERLCFRINADR